MYMLSYSKLYNVKKLNKYLNQIKRKFAQKDKNN